MGLGDRKLGVHTWWLYLHMVAALLPLLVSLSFSLSALDERGWESSGGPLRPPFVTLFLAEGVRGALLTLEAASRADSGDSKNGRASRVSGTGRRRAQLCLGLGKP